MDTVADELLIDEYYPSEEDLIKETWSLPLDNKVKEFEEYLLDIGVRI